MKGELSPKATERFERNGFDNLSVICFANATSPYTGEALTAAAGISPSVTAHAVTAPSTKRGPLRADRVVRPYKCYRKGPQSGACTKRRFPLI